MRSSGRSIINGIELKELELNCFSSTPRVKATFALCAYPKDSAEPSLCGRVTLDLPWSEDVARAITELKRALEADLLAMMFVNSVVEPDTAEADTPDQVPSL